MQVALQKLKVHWLLLLAGVSTFLILNNANVSAENFDFDLKISGIECTVDETYSGIVPAYIINPEDCTEPPIIDKLPEKDIPPASRPNNVTDPNVPGDNTAGNQRIFEDTFLEPLARTVGIGDSSTSIARPAATAGIFIGGLTLIVDNLLYGSRVSQAALNLLRRRQ